MDNENKKDNIIDDLDDNDIKYYIRDFTKNGRNYTKIVVNEIGIFKKEWECLKNLNFSIGNGYYYKTFEK